MTFDFDPYPIHKHGGGEVYDAWGSPPPVGDRDALASPSPPGGDKEQDKDSVSRRCLRCWMFEVSCPTVETSSDSLLDDYFSTVYIVFGTEVDPTAAPAADFSLCIFDHYSFIFREPESGPKLLHSMIYDIPSQQRMKNKLDFPTPFPDQPPPTPATSSPPSFHHTCLSSCQYTWHLGCETNTVCEQRVCSNSACRVPLAAWCHSD